MAPTLKAKVLRWIEPAHLLKFAMYQYLIVFWQSLWHSPRDLFNGVAYWKAFAMLWLEISPPAKANATVERPTEGPAIALPDLLNGAQGVVLELGSGSGSLMPFLDRSKIDRMYSVEPAVNLHAALAQSAAAIGFTKDNFTILPCGGEAHSLVPMLAKQKTLDINEGPVFDTIICIRSLCTLAPQREAIQAHYSLLKPGGKMIIYEHVVNPWPRADGSIVGRFMQLALTALGWHYFVGCSLSRDTIKLLEEAAAVDGGWEKIDVVRDLQWATLPWSYGTLTKKF